MVRKVTFSDKRPEFPIRNFGIKGLGSRINGLGFGLYVKGFGI